MHHLLGVVIHPGDDTDEGVEKRLEPHRKNDIDWEEWRGRIFDWYAIGGRWDGLWSESNRVGVAELLALDDHMPFAVLLPDAGYHARRLWNGEDFIDTPDWENVVRDLLASFAAADIVAVDIHG